MRFREQCASMGRRQRGMRLSLAGASGWCGSSGPGEYSTRPVLEQAYWRKSLWHAVQAFCSFRAAAFTWAGFLPSSDLMRSFEASCMSLEYSCHFLVVSLVFLASSLGMWTAIPATA